MKKLLLLAACALSACTTYQGTFTVLSNKNIDVNNFKLDQTDKVTNAVGEDKAHIIIFIPTKGNPNLNDALSDAFRKYGGDVMTDVTVSRTSWYIPYIYGEVSWKVEGDVVRTRKETHPKANPAIPNDNK